MAKVTKVKKAVSCKRREKKNIDRGYRLVQRRFFELPRFPQVHALRRSDGF